MSLNNFDGIDLVQLEKEYNECCDPAKGTFEEFKTQFLANRKNRAKIAILKNMGSTIYPLERMP